MEYSTATLNTYSPQGEDCGQGVGYSLFVVQRQPQRESGSNSQGAGDFDRSVVIVDYFFRDVESETGAVFALFGSEIGLEDFPDFLLRNSVPGVSHLDVSVKILLLAIHYNLSALIGCGLDGIYNDVLQRARELRRVAEDHAMFFGNFAVQLDAVLRGHAADPPADVLDDAGQRDRFRFDCADPAVALPHRQKLTAKPHVLFDNVQFSR
jgi:hypothetical protein